MISLQFFLSPPLLKSIVRDVGDIFESLSAILQLVSTCSSAQLCSGLSRFVCVAIHFKVLSVHLSSSLLIVYLPHWYLTFDKHSLYHEYGILFVDRNCEAQLDVVYTGCPLENNA